MEIQISGIINSIQETHHVLGRIDRYVRNARPIDQADEYSLCFCKEDGKRALEIIKSSKATAIICSDRLEFPQGETWDKTIIRVTNPRLTYSRLLTKYFFIRTEHAIHPTAIIDEKSKIGDNVQIGPNSYLGDCQIGDGTIIDSHVCIDHGAIIGNRVIIHTGVVIGTEAVAFERNGNGELEWFPQLSGIIIEDDVELGANTVICRGSLSDTVICKGTKIDNLVRVGHGAKIGNHCIIVAGTIICGSTEIGDQTWIGPLVCIREGISIGNRVVVGAGSVVHKDIPDNSVVTGSPVRPIPNEIVNKYWKI